MTSTEYREPQKGLPTNEGHGALALPFVVRSPDFGLLCSTCAKRAPRTLARFSLLSLLHHQQSIQHLASGTFNFIVSQK